MVGRPTHPSKEIEAAVSFAEEQGWSWVKVSGHAWAKLLCPHHDRDGCVLFVWSTPRNPENHARQLLRQIARCPHHAAGDADEGI
ncbi:MAG: hypothetical protein HZA66_06030 [Rhodopseudomonas palustris]|uniref:Uncharacterized protein n=1 Tax=Rhodopseudomonas palustris TaxID=1076 RepID=A0A933RUS4_RHOPL|nr:hypothetical protein [Rhodopseudomonas palustris]